MKIRTLFKLSILLIFVGSIVGGVIYYLNRDNFKDDFEDFIDEDDSFLDDNYIHIDINNNVAEANN